MTPDKTYKFKQTGRLIGNTYYTSRKRLENLNVDPSEIHERQQLLDWLKYNDYMYFERIEKSVNIKVDEDYWFQVYIKMPLDQLRKKVNYIMSLNQGFEEY